METAHPLDELLRRIGAELAAQSEAAEGLSALVPLLPALDAPLRMRAQSIDALAQHLAELATLLRSLADVAPTAGVPPSLIDAVRLSGLADRLAGRDAGPADPAGELDLF